MVALGCAGCSVSRMGGAPVDLLVARSILFFSEVDFFLPGGGMGVGTQLL